MNNKSPILKIHMLEQQGTKKRSNKADKKRIQKKLIILNNEMIDEVVSLPRLAHSVRGIPCWQTYGHNGGVECDWVLRFYQGNVMVVV